MNNFDERFLYPEAIEIDDRLNNNYLATPYVGLVRGNMFNELYQGYKSYRPRELKASNDKEKLMLDIMMYSTAMQDLNLYLDLHPEDTNIINLRGRYLDLYKDAVNKYESRYGALTLKSDVTKKSPWDWDKNNFPWKEMK